VLPASPLQETAVPQGTIRTFDIASRTATLLTDALVEHEVDREAVTASGLMELRIGQRVRFELDGERITQLNIVSL
jgi:cold shock CspA family protein